MSGTEAGFSAATSSFVPSILLLVNLIVTYENFVLDSLNTTSSGQSISENKTVIIFWSIDLYLNISWKSLLGRVWVYKTLILGRVDS